MSLLCYCMDQYNRPALYGFKSDGRRYSIDRIQFNCQCNSPKTSAFGTRKTPETERHSKMYPACKPTRDFLFIFFFVSNPPRQPFFLRLNALSHLSYNGTLHGIFWVGLYTLQDEGCRIQSYYSHCVYPKYHQLFCAHNHRYTDDTLRLAYAKTADGQS